MKMYDSEENHMKAPEKTAGDAQSGDSAGFFNSVAEILRKARGNSYRAVNFVMVKAYWNVGRMIFEEEQLGKQRADYGKALLRGLSRKLTLEFGPGFDPSNLAKFRQFYLAFPILDTLCLKSFAAAGVPEGQEEKFHALRGELSWSHYRLLMRVNKSESREWYMNEAAEQNWSVRALERQINSLHYERMLMSRDKSPIAEEMRAKTALLAPEPKDFIKDPYVLEFLGLQDNPSFREADLEQAIIGKLQAFMLELGKGFAFVARQQRVSTETKDFFVDLVFYNYILKCFVLIDLKVGELTHQDIGQMDMYVRLYEDRVKGEGDNPTVGIILCTEKDHTVVQYSVLNESSQLFASKYRLYLPSEEELRAEVEREREMVVRERMEGYSAEDKFCSTVKQSGDQLT